MLRAVLDISKNTHVTNKIMYEEIPRVNEKIALRRMRLTGAYKDTAKGIESCRPANGCCGNQRMDIGHKDVPC